MSHAVKYPPFMKGTVYPPSNVPRQLDANPPFTLELDYIYGSSRKGCKGDILHTNASGDLVYPAAACGVVMDVETMTQKYVFRKHVDDVKCITMHPNGKVAATGECGLDDMIYVWSCDDDCQTLASLKSFQWFTHGGVLSVCFGGNDLLAAVGGAPEATTLLIFNWRNGRLMAKCPCARRVTFGMAANPHSVNGQDFVWYGKDSIKFFRYQSGAINVQKGIVTANGGSVQSMYCCIFDNSAENPHSYLGTKDGSIYVFSGNRLVNKQQLHRGTLFTLEKLPDGFATGGKDGTVKICQFGARPGSFSVVKELSIRSAVGSLGLSPDARTVYTFGKFDSRIASVDVETEQVKTIAVSHSGLSIRNELWGIDVVPNAPHFVSAGDDGKIIIWNYETHQYLHLAKKQRHNFRAVAVHPSGTQFAVSTKAGFVAVFDMQGFITDDDAIPDHEVAVQCGPEEIAALRYSPDGSILAAGSHDNAIYLLDVARNYRKLRPLKGHTSFITGIDWSADGQFMQSTSGDYELLYWNVGTRERVLRGSDMADTEWATQTCVLGWKVRGIWEGGKHGQGDGTDINGVSRHGDMMVSVDDFGQVNTYRYPTVMENAPEDRYIGHCSHVTTARFSPDGRYVFTTGGGDLTIFQWRVVRRE